MPLLRAGHWCDLWYLCFYNIIFLIDQEMQNGDIVNLSFCLHLSFFILMLILCHAGYLFPAQLTLHA